MQNRFSEWVLGGGWEKQGGAWGGAWYLTTVPPVRLEARKEKKPCKVNVPHAHTRKARRGLFLCIHSIISKLRQKTPHFSHDL